MNAGLLDSIGLGDGRAASPADRQGTTPGRVYKGGKTRLSADEMDDDEQKEDGSKILIRLIQ